MFRLEPSPDQLPDRLRARRHAIAPPEVVDRLDQRLRHRGDDAFDALYFRLRHGRMKYRQVPGHHKYVVGIRSILRVQRWRQGHSAQRLPDQTLPCWG